MNKANLSLLKILLFDRMTSKFAIGVTLGLSFSISIILATIGIMDGFDKTLRQGLTKSSGHIYLYGRNKFFDEFDYHKTLFKRVGIGSISYLIQTEGFLIANENSKAVLIKGISPKGFSYTTKFPVKVSKGSVAVGKELAERLKIEIGSPLVIAFAEGNEDFDGMPLIKQFRVSDIVEHGIYEKDDRYIYSHIDDIREVLKVGKKSNLVLMRLAGNDDDLQGRIESAVSVLDDEMGFEYIFRPYWSEFSSLIEAVKVEKFMIGIVLQLVVIISIFNVVAFISFINEKKAQDIFLFRALGMSQKKISTSWYLLMFLLWGISCFFSIYLVKVFDYFLQNLSLLKLPGEVYHLGRIKMDIGGADYLFVFGLALFWLILITFFAFRRLSKKSILSGLRKEFA